MVGLRSNIVGLRFNIEELRSTSEQRRVAGVCRVCVRRVVALRRVAGVRFVVDVW